MISFIVIGRNEGEKLRKCLQSISDSIDPSFMQNYELIYVDSDSSDNSLTIAESCILKSKKIIQVKGDTSPAVGRNAGARFASGDVFFFIDGDMEINPGFMHLIRKDLDETNHGYISGQLIQNYLDKKGNITVQEPVFKNLKSDRYEKTTGGVFLVKADLWKSVNGMREKYFAQEDLDFGYRLIRNTGTQLLRKKDVIAYHNTISVYSRKSISEYTLIFKRQVYKGTFLRDHLFNRHIYGRLIKMDATFLVLVASIFASLATLYCLLFYPLTIIARGAYNLIRGKKDVAGRMVNYILRDFATLAGFLFFYPGRPKYEVFSISGQ